jgi:SPP1 gp7 family putative phage head morphogenesis protein
MLIGSDLPAQLQGAILKRDMMSPITSRPLPAPWPGLKWSFKDAAAGASQFASPRSAERHYAKQLGSVAGRIRTIVDGRGSPEKKQALLRKYAETLGPWAENAAAAMTSAVDRKNRQTWESHASKISKGLRQQLKQKIDDVTLSEINRRNAKLIKDLPLGAADKIADMATEATVTGTRAEQLAARIAEVGEMAHNRAQIIARTEVSKVSTTLTKARAAMVGSEGYIWRTSRDGDVRDGHAQMEGKFVRWDDPPRVDGIKAHAGEAPNCRCYPEPVIPKTGADTPNGYKPPLPLAEDVKADPQTGLISHWEQQNKLIIRHMDGDTLPGANEPIIPREKLAGYVLNADHPTGGHKARVLKSALGFDESTAGQFEKQLLQKLPETAAIRDKDLSAGFGEKFTAYVPMTGPNGRTVDVKTVWMYDRKKRKQSGTPRLVTAYVAD